MRCNLIFLQSIKLVTNTTDDPNVQTRAPTLGLNALVESQRRPYAEFKRKQPRDDAHVGETARDR